MSDDSYSFSTARTRLDEIVTQVRKKDTSLEKSLDLLEEGVRLANACTELIDHADWTVGGVDDAASPDVEGACEPSDDAQPVEAATDAEDAETSEPADEEYAPGDDAFGDVADGAWADDTPEYRDDEA